MRIPLLAKIFEKLILTALMGLMGVVVVMITLELVWLVWNKVVTAPFTMLGGDKLLEILGDFLLVLIALELFETVHTYFEERVIRVEVVVFVAITAICRKVIILDYKSLTSFTLLDVGVVILSFAGAYYVLRRVFR